MDQKLCNDTIMIIMSYLPSRQVILSCTGVSKQFYNVALSLHRAELPHVDCLKWVRSLKETPPEQTYWLSDLLPDVSGWKLGDWRRWLPTVFNLQSDHPNTTERGNIQPPPLPSLPRFNLNVVSLDFSHTVLQGDFFERLISCNLKNLTRLNLSDCIGEGRAGLSLALSHHTSSLIHLDVGGYGKEVNSLSGHTIMNSLTYLDISQNDLTTIPMTAGRQKSCLQTLRMNKNSIQDHAFCEWVEWGFTPSLTFLDMSDNGVDDSSVVVLCSAVRSQLVHLSIQLNNISNLGISHLSSHSHHLPSLAHLGITCGKASVSGGSLLAPLLVRERQYQKIETLTLERSVIGIDFALALSEQDHSIRELVLSRCGLTVEAIPCLLELSPRLTRLDLSHSISVGRKLGPMMNEHVRGRDTFCAMVHLRLSDIGVDCDMMRAICKSAKNLRTLDLSSNVIRNDGLLALAESSCVTRLEQLDLSYNSFTSDGMRALVESPNLIHLEYLNINECSVDDTVVLSILHTPFLKSLVTFYAVGTHITKEGARMVESSPRMSELSLFNHTHGSIYRANTSRTITTDPQSYTVYL